GWCRVPRGLRRARAHRRHRARGVVPPLATAGERRRSPTPDHLERDDFALALVATGPASFPRGSTRVLHPRTQSAWTSRSSHIVDTAGDDVRHDEIGLLHRKEVGGFGQMDLGGVPKLAYELRPSRRVREVRDKEAFRMAPSTDDVHRYVDRTHALVDVR